MGINGLNKFLKKECPWAYKSVPITNFSNTDIAVDLPIIVWKHYVVQFAISVGTIDIRYEEPDIDAINKCTINAVISSLSKHFIENRIRPIIILDGTADEEKHLHAGLRRKKEWEIRKSKVEKLRELLKTDITLFEETYKSMCAAAKPSKDLIDNLILKLEDKGFPIINAKGEAEELCTMLCKSNYVSAVYSTDTDNIVRKCPNLITNIKYDEDGNQIATLFTWSPKIYKSLGFDYNSFLDLCILMGCDYNDKIEGIGDMKAYNLIFYYRTLESIKENTEYVLESLNYLHCRKIFAERSIEECCVNMELLDLIF